MGTFLDPLRDVNDSRPQGAKLEPAPGSWGQTTWIVGSDHGSWAG